jgi:hypothetical protein
MGVDGLLLLATRLKVAAFDLKTHDFRVLKESNEGIIIESIDVNGGRVLAA